MFRIGTIVLQRAGGQRIDDVPALLAIAHEFGVEKDVEMMRGVDHGDAQTGGYFADVARPLPQQTDDAQPIRRGESAEFLRADAGFEIVFHRDVSQEFGRDLTRSSISILHAGA